MHKGYEFEPVALPIPALEEALAEKLAAWRRRRKMRDLYDLYWFGQGALDEALVRRVLLLKVWHDVVDDGLGTSLFDPAEIVAAFEAEKLPPEEIGLLTQPVEPDRWAAAVCDRYRFVADLDDNERQVARCNPGDRYVVDQLTAALAGRRRNRSLQSFLVNRTGGRSFGGGPESARNLLSTIAAAIVTSISLIFPVTMIVSGWRVRQYSPRVLRTFIRDRLVFSFEPLCRWGPWAAGALPHGWPAPLGRAVALRWFDAMRSDDPPSRRFSSVLLAALWTLALLLGAPVAVPAPGAAVGTHGEIAAEESRGGDLVASRDRATAERRNLRLRRRKAHRVGRCRRVWGCDRAALALAAGWWSSPLRGPPLRALT